LPIKDDSSLVYLELSLGPSQIGDNKLVVDSP